MTKPLRLLVMACVGAVWLSLSATTPTQAQRLCETIVQQALSAAGQNCQGLDGEQACYAYDSINPTFYTEDVDGNALRSPGTSVELPIVHTVQSSPYDEDEDEWGIGYFQVALEELLNEDTVRIIMMGDVLLENAVAAGDENAEFEPFEQLYVQAGGRSACQEAMNDMVVQTPRDVAVELNINNVPVEFGSTVVFGLVEENGQLVMYIAVLDGAVTLFPGTPDEVTIEENQVTSAPIAPIPDGDNPRAVPILNTLTGEPILGPDGQPAFRLAPFDVFEEPVDLSEDGEGFRGFGYYATVYELPAELLNYPIELPAFLQEETQQADTDTPANEDGTSTEDTAETAPPAATGTFNITLLSCAASGAELSETWSVSGLPAGVDRIFFVGDGETTIAPVSGEVNVETTSATRYAYAFVNGDIIEAVENYGEGCPEPPATTEEFTVAPGVDTFVVVPTVPPPPPRPGEDRGSSSSDDTAPSDSYGYGAALPTDEITARYAAAANNHRHNLLGITIILVVGMVGWFGIFERRGKTDKDNT